MSNILLIVTGSIAAYKAVDLAKKLQRGTYKHSVKVVLTESAKKFIPSIVFTSQGIEAYSEEDEWKNINFLNAEASSVLHISLAKWADIVLVAPATFNTISKYHHGICDNLALSCMHAFAGTVYIAPAMNTVMYENLQDTLQKITLEKNAVVLPTAVKQLACGDTGEGGLLDLKEIESLIQNPIFPLKLHFSSTKDSESFKEKDLSKETEVPYQPHVGSYLQERKHDVHTGIDLYCNEGEPVYSMQEGVVEYQGLFTGLNAGTPWWNETSFVLVKNPFDRILYGEIEPKAGVKVGTVIKKGQPLGKVIRVLPNDKGRPTSMLHVERYDYKGSFEGPILSLSKGFDNSELLKTHLRSPATLVTYSTPRR